MRAKVIDTDKGVAMALRQRAIAVLTAGLLAFGTTGAQSAEEGVFDISVLGIRAATLSFAGQIDGSRYSASGRVQTTGLLNMVSEVAYAAQVQGRYRNGQFQPRLYRETAREGGETYAGEMRYSGRTPQPKGYAPPRDQPAGALNPATQTGTVDIMTIVFAVVRDQPRSGVCDVSLQMFDGVRRGQVTLTNPVEGRRGQITCSGEYRRLEGFSAAAMAERQRFPFSLTYSPLSDGTYRVTQVQAQTTFGRATFRRR